MPTYDNDFFKYVNSGAITSANEILPILVNAIPVTSVLDVGCGQGAWLSVWNKLGVTDLLGIDGDYVDRNNLLIDQSKFNSYDLSGGFELNRSFDLVQSLEVAEHLPESAAQGFVEKLIRYGDIILFSAAPKGQGGDYHINEQTYDYWRDLFTREGYQVFDYIRPLISGKNNIEPWYRYNIFLYISSNCIENLPHDIRRTLVPAGEKLSDISPLLYKVRKMLVRLLPVRVITAAAKIKERLITLIRS